jgi:hypothetical protein
LLVPNQLEPLRLSYERKYYFKRQTIVSTKPTGTATTEPRL